MTQHTAGDQPETPRNWSEMVSEDPAEWPLGRLLSAAARRVEHEWNGHLGAWELNHASFPVLMMLLGGPHTQAELAHAGQITEQTMSRILSRLERTGHIRRTQHRMDRRKHQVEITDLGRSAALRAADQQAADRIAARGLSAEQVDQLRSLLAAVVRPAD